MSATSRQKGDGRRIAAPGPVRGKSATSAATTTVIVACGILLRSLVGMHSPSGYGDDHSGGAPAGPSSSPLPAYGGDFEAQRHWMEITYHLPISEWYTHDPEYWGLDYPPLTAYVSYACGWLSHVLVGPESVALGASRGYEQRDHLAFLRATVLALDVAVYFTAVLAIAGRIAPDGAGRRALVLLALCQPAVVLIDHGHFQYNTVALGLALWSFYYVTAEGAFGRTCVVGAVLFALALNFKQMTLYFAPAIFAYLLGRCAGAKTWAGAASRFVALGSAVLSTFAALWWPFYVYPDAQMGGPGSVLHVLRRQFPFARGLFEGKVANLWCALDVRPVNVRARIPAALHAPLALAATLLLLAPACAALYAAGRGADAASASRHRTGLRALLWGASATGLSFFLASFQVHEKSVLMPLAPLSLLCHDLPGFVAWFSVVAAWTLWPLMQQDKLQLAYFSVLTIFQVLLHGTEGGATLAPKDAMAVWEKIGGPCQTLCTLIKVGSFAAMILLHVVQAAVPPPARLPDVYPVLWSVVGCGCLCCAWFVTTYVSVTQFRSGAASPSVIKKKNQ